MPLLTPVPLVPLCAVVLAGYLLGSVPTGLIVGKLYRGIDVREYGSGRTGATNVLRTLGPGASALVLAGDAAKGVLAVLAARAVLERMGLPWWPDIGAVLASLAALAGHNWPAFFGFRGGRGVAVAAGSMAVLIPPVFVVAAVVGVAVIALSRFVSLGSVVATVIAILLIISFVLVGKYPAPDVLFSLVAGGVILLQHRDNIERLRTGTERKLGQHETLGSTAR